MDPQVADIYGAGAWAVDTCKGYVQEFERCGDALGLHTHLYRLEPATGAWLIDNADPEWVRHCVRSSYDCFEKALGRTPILHRFGDRFFDSTALAALELAGCRCDLTPEPGFTELPGSQLARMMTGDPPDMTAVPKLPYRPSPEDFTRPAASGDGGLWLLPLSTGYVRRGVRGLFRLSPLYPLHLGLDCGLFSRVAARLINTLPRPYLGIVLKTDMLLDDRLADNMRRNLSFFMHHRTPDRFVFARPEEAMDILGYTL